MLKSLFGDRSARRHFQFWLMMWLSVTIAVMGLSLGSAAIVIGAMLIAPLMTPVMQFADRVDSVEVAGREVRVELSGAQTPPPANSLSERMAEELGKKPVVRISWTQQVVEKSGEASEDVEVRRRARAAVDSWVRNQSGLDAVDVSYRDGVVTVDLAGSVVPPNVTSVVRAVQAGVGRDVPVTVRFVERRVLI